MGKAADPVELLRTARSVLLIDWPSRDVPDALARAGLAVTADEGPSNLVGYEIDGEAVTARPLDRPPVRIDVVYAHRPLAELPGIAAQALALAARAVWLQSGRNAVGAHDPRGCWLANHEAAMAREIVEAAGLLFVHQPYIGDVARGLAAD